MADYQNRFESPKKKLKRLVEEIVQLQSVLTEPVEYCGEFLVRVLTAVAAPAGAIWLVNTHGNLQLLYHVNFNLINLESSECREQHNAILIAALLGTRSLVLKPSEQLHEDKEPKPSAINPTEYAILLAPLRVNGHTMGLVEVFQYANRHPNSLAGFLQFIQKMADLASNYFR
jgi:hypothetical protein